MATGWAGDNAVNDQIDATVKDGIQRVRDRMPKGPSLEALRRMRRGHSRSAPRSRARRAPVRAVPGSGRIAKNRPSAATTAAEARTVNCAEGKGKGMAREARKRRGIKRTLFVCCCSWCVALVVWTKFSPWPSALAIRAVFDIGGAKIARKLEKHVPTSGINELRDVNYDGHDPDAKLDLFVPAGKPPRTTIVWIHGGGFVAGRKSEVANYARILASKGYGVASIEYARAPGAHYPVPVEQANRALAMVVDQRAALRDRARSLRARRRFGGRADRGATGQCRHEPGLRARISASSPRSRPRASSA